jgi:hypothetical protein
MKYGTGATHFVSAWHLWMLGCKSVRGLWPMLSDVGPVGAWAVGGAERWRWARGLWPTLSD